MYILQSNCILVDTSRDCMNAWVVDETIFSVFSAAVLSVWELGVIHCRCSWYRPVLIVTPEPEPSGGRGVFLVAGGGGGRTDPDISRYNWLPASAPLPQLPLHFQPSHSRPSWCLHFIQGAGGIRRRTYMIPSTLDWVGEIFTKKHIAEFAIK